jgi:uncharacterized protein YjbJ (UPF0337 family)
MAVDVGDVSLKAVLDVADAEEKATQFSRKVAWEIAEAAARGEKGFEKFSKMSAEEIQKFADRAAKHLEKVSFSAKLKNAAKELPGVLGDVGDAINMLGADFLGLSEEQAKAIDGTLSMAEKGGQILGVLGPWGAAVGALAGAVIGYVKAGKDAERLEFQRGFERTLGTAERITKNLEAQIKQEKQRAEAAKLIHEWKTGELAVTDDLLERTRRLIDAEKRRAEIREEAGRLAMTPAEIRTELKEAQAEYDALLEDQRRGGGALIEEALLKAKERLDAAKSAMSGLGTATKNTGKDLEGAVAKAFSPFSRVLGQVSDQASDATDAMDRFVPSANSVSAAIQKIKPPPGWDEFTKAFIEANVKVDNFAKELEQLTAQEETALAVAEAWGTHALGGFEKFLDGVQAGNKIIGSMDWDEALVNFLRLTGSQLMASGLQHELAAAAARFLGNKKDAVGLAAVGAAELATGAAMGGTGALIGRRRGVGGVGGREDRDFGGNFSLGRNANTTNNTNNTQNTYIIQALDIGDRELWERLGARVERARGAFRRAGGRLLDGRN